MKIFMYWKYEQKNVDISSLERVYTGITHPWAAGWWKAPVGVPGWTTRPDAGSQMYRPSWVRWSTGRGAWKAAKADGNWSGKPADAGEWTWWNASFSGIIAPLTLDQTFHTHLHFAQSFNQIWRLQRRGVTSSMVMSSLFNSRHVLCWKRTESPAALSSFSYHWSPSRTPTIKSQGAKQQWWRVRLSTVLESVVVVVLFTRLTAQLYNSTKLENWLLLGIGASNSWPLCPSAPQLGPTHPPASHPNPSNCLPSSPVHPPSLLLLQAGLIYSPHIYKGRSMRDRDR